MRDLENLKNKLVFSIFFIILHFFLFKIKKNKQKLKNQKQNCEMVRGAIKFLFSIICLKVTSLLLVKMKKNRHKI